MSSNCTRKDNYVRYTQRSSPNQLRIEKIFPKLTPEQIRRIAAYGLMRSVQPGEVLIEQGDTSFTVLCCDNR